MKKTGLWVLILGILLLLAIGYITYDLVSASVSNRQAAFYQAGAQYGYEQAVYQIAQQSTSCNTIPLNIENQTIELIALSCLSQA